MADSALVRIQNALEGVSLPLDHIKVDKDIFDQFQAEVMSGATDDNASPALVVNGLPVVFDETVGFGKIVPVAKLADAPAPDTAPAKSLAARLKDKAADS